MKCNLTLYGPVHSGKSTLAGFMYTQKMSSAELGRLDQRIMDSLGTDYDPAQRIAYYVDTAPDERRRNKNISSIGTSKHLHYIKVNIAGQGDMLLIDSPGSSQKWRQNYRSSFLGDIGILVYSISSFASLSRLERGTAAYERERDKLLWQVELWKEYKNINRLVIAISKMDGESAQKSVVSGSFSRILFAQAVSVIKSDPELQMIPIVPIAIDVKKRLEHNVYTKSPMMEWYSGQPLIEVIYTKMQSFPSQESMVPYTFASIVEKLRIKETQEPVFRIKVLSGAVKKGDSVAITQVKESRAASYKMGTATIKSIKSDSGNPTTFLVENEVGGITLGKITVDGKSTSAGSLLLSRSSYVIAPHAKMETGNILTLKAQKDIRQTETFRLQDKVKLLMYGKIISMILVGKWYEGETCCLDVYAKAYPLVLPVCDNGEMAFPNYVIEKENMEFLAVKLTGMRFLEKNVPAILRVVFDHSEINTEETEEAFQGLPLKESGSGFYDFKVTPESLEMISSRLRKFFQKYHILDYSAKLIDLNPKQ